MRLWSTGVGGGGLTAISVFMLSSQHGDRVLVRSWTTSSFSSEQACSRSLVCRPDTKHDWLHDDVESNQIT